MKMTISDKEAIESEYRILVSELEEAKSKEERTKLVKEITKLTRKLERYNDYDQTNNNYDTIKNFNQIEDNKDADKDKFEITNDLTKKLYEPLPDEIIGKIYQDPNKYTFGDNFVDNKEINKSNNPPYNETSKPKIIIAEKKSIIAKIKKILGF